MSYLQRIFSKPAHIPSLSATVMELSKLTQDDYAGSKQVAAALSKDQGLSAKLLRLANAASYGSRGKVDSLEQALAIVGTADFRVLVLASGAIAASARAPGLDLTSHLRHAFLTASIAARLDEEMGRSGGLCYLAGLLHTIGITLMHAADPATAQVVADHCGSLDLADRAQYEREILGTDHAEIGAELLRRWRLPERLIEKIRLFPDADPSEHPQSAIVRISSRAANECIIGVGRVEIWQRIAIGLEMDGNAVETLDDCLAAGEAEAQAFVKEMSLAT